MLKYFHIIKFLMTHETNKLKENLNNDYSINKHFSWLRILNRIKKSEYEQFNTSYLFWFRIANEMFKEGNKQQKRVAILIHKELRCKFGIDIMLGCKIGKNISIAHYTGIVISDCVEIGDNFSIKQNVTIGVSSLPEFDNGINQKQIIQIGDNVSIGANCCIIGNDIKIGNNSKIGAMSFINKDIPDNCTVYTEKTNIVKIKAH